MNSSRKDMVVKYSPSETVKSDLRKIGHDINFSEIKLRLLKRKIKGKLYVFATTLTKRKVYPMGQTKNDSKRET